jgi:5'-3' exonuclease
MGVPGLFVWLTKKYKNIIKFNIEHNVDILYLDANCLIHPVTQKVLADNIGWTNKNLIETKMLDEITKYIDMLIDFVEPKKMIYIAVDGVAPCAKIKHQRMRRFKSIKNRNQIDALKRKHKMKTEKKWSNTAITPGTEFMEKITDHLIEYSTSKSDNIIFSSAKEPGEGEHKILQHINNNITDENIVIYGLDADLIYLALSSQKRNIHLLREVIHFGKINNENKNKNKNKNEDEDENENEDEDEDEDENVEFNYLCIDSLRNRLYEEISNKIDFEVEVNDVVKDFIFIGYFMGNDFLPNIPSIDIKRKGLDILINAYTKTMNFLEGHVKHFFLDLETVNNIFLRAFLNYLAKIENNHFIDIYNVPLYKHRVNMQTMEPYEKDLYKLNNLKFNINDPVKLGSDEPEFWKSRYYDVNFKIKSEDGIDDVCKHFLDGLYWTSNYYFKKCCSYSWYYPYNHGPMISDLYIYFNENINYFDNINLSKSEPLKPFEQLLCVLPPTCAYLLPKSMQYLMLKKDSPLIDLYPQRFEEDLVNKQMLWQGIPLLPKLDIDRIKKIINYKYITKEENKRNISIY